MRPEPFTLPAYVAAFGELAGRIARALEHVSPAVLPIRMIVAGDAALHFHTGARVSVDIDAAFSHRIVLPDELATSYADADGMARVLYVDRNYNDALGLLHEDARDDALPLTLDGVDPGVLDVRVLTPVDLAVSKLGRWSTQDRSDVAELARRRLFTPEALEQRALEALGGYVGDTRRVRGAIDDAVRMAAGITASTP